jgi:autotransporter-associated beta strand protein
MTLKFPLHPQMKPRRAALFAALALGAALHASAQTSELWGVQGELWSPASRLPDFSFAGYRSGGAAIPAPAVVANVMNFGAVGDGVADDTTAFENAIAAANNGTVLIPAGRYKITRVLYIRKSNLVLRGAGQGLTTLVFTKHLTELLGAPPGTDGLESWSWSGGLIWVEGAETTTKIADVTAAADRGGSVLTLSSTAGLSVGQTVRLMMTDPDGSLGRHIHAEQLDTPPALVGRRLVRFPSKITAISGNQITLERPLRLNVRTAWSPEIHTFSGHLEEVGLEDFKMEFPTRAYQGHFTEDGFNGIWMDGVWNSWIRNVTVHNCENGVMIERSAFCTADGVQLTAATGNRYNVSGTYYTGHHGIQLRRSDDCMVSNFSLQTRFYHDLTVEDTTGSVFMKGSGVDLNFDHHTYLPYENLFTEIASGAGSRHFSSSGSANPESAARETLWNVTSTAQITTLPNPSPSRGLWPQLNFIGIPTSLATTRSATGSWIEAIAPASLNPGNLYEAQLARRVSPPPVVSRSFTWDGSGVGTTGAQGGNGTWDANSTSNWWNGSSNEVWPAGGGTDDHAVLGGTAGTVTVAAAGVAVRSITVNTAAYTLGGGTIILNGQNPVITANHGGNTTNITSVIAGSSGLSKSGPSTVQLRAANRYSGDTRVLQGNLLIGAGDNRLPVTTRLILGDGSNSGTFQMNSRSQQVGGLATGGTSTASRVINSSTTATTFTVDIANKADTDLFAGTLGGEGANDNHYQFVKAGPGKLILAGGSTYTGNTTIAGGTLQIGNDGAAGALAPAAVTNNGTLRFDRSDTLTVPNDISGTGGIHVDGPSGTVELRGANTFTGNITITNGTLDIIDASSLGTGAKAIDITTGLGTLRLNGGAITIPASVTLNTSGEPGPGRIHNLAGDNLIAGPVNLTLGAGNTLITSDGGTLTLAGTITAPTASRTLKLGGASIGGNQITGGILETAGRVISLEKTGAGTWSLAAPGTYTGTTLVTAGILKISHNTALGATSAGTTVNTGAKLQLQGASLNIAENLTLGTGSTGATIENLSGENILSGTLTRNGALTLVSTSGKLSIQGNIGDTNSTLNLQGDGDGEISGAITSASSVVKTGSGAWKLSGASTHTNITTVNGGRLVLSGSLAGPLTVFTGTLAPQGSPSTSSSLNLQPNGRFEVLPGDTLTVGSTVTLGGNLDIIAPPGLAIGTSYTILNKTSAGSVSGSFTGKPAGSTFTASGYTWQITYTGGTGNDIVITLQPTALTAAETWRQLYFGTTDNSGNAADSYDGNHDGENNLMEFATGQDPNAGTIALTSVVKSATNLEFTYTRSKAAFDDGYLFDVQYSNTLTPPWTSAGAGTLITDGSMQTLKATISNAGAEKRFARLKIETP